MPLGEFEREVLRVIGANRHPDGFIGGATVLLNSANAPRSSRDVGVFHDTEECLARAVEADAAALQAAGICVEWGEPMKTFRRARLTRNGQETKVEWVFDSAFRFFPVEPDVDLGWRLNFWDAATNKVLALASRREFRDYLDAHFLYDRHLHLGALVWAAAGKDPGLTPEYIVSWIRRNTHYSPDEIEKVRPVNRPDLVVLKQRWFELLDEAETLFRALPAAELGCFYLDASGRPLFPDPVSPGFAELTRHYGSVRGAWPRIVG